MEILTVLSKSPFWAFASDAFNILSYTFCLGIAARFLEVNPSVKVTSPGPYGSPTVPQPPTPTSFVVPPLPTPWFCVMLVLIGVALPTIRLAYMVQRSTPPTPSSLLTSTSFNTRSKAHVKVWPTVAHPNVSGFGNPTSYTRRVLAFLASGQALRAISYGLILAHCTPAMHAASPLQLSATSATYLPILTGILTAFVTLYPAIRKFRVHLDNDPTAYIHPIRSVDSSTARGIPPSVPETENYVQDQHADAELDNDDSNILFVNTPASPINIDTNTDHVRRWLEHVHHAGLEPFSDFEEETPRNIDGDTDSEIFDWYRIFDERQTDEAADVDSNTDDLENEHEERVVFHALMDDADSDTDKRDLDELIMTDEREESEAFLMLTDLAREDEVVVSLTSDIGSEAPQTQVQHEKHVIFHTLMDEAVSRMDGQDLSMDQLASSEYETFLRLAGLAREDESEVSTSTVGLEEHQVQSFDVPPLAQADEEPEDDLSAVEVDDELSSSDAEPIPADKSASVGELDLGHADSTAVVNDIPLIDVSGVEDDVHTSSSDVDVQPSTLLSSSCLETNIQHFSSPNTDVPPSSQIEHDTPFSTANKADIQHSSTDVKLTAPFSSSTEPNVPASSSDIQILEILPSDIEPETPVSDTLEYGSNYATYEENTNIDAYRFETRDTSPLSLADLYISRPENELTPPEDEVDTQSMISASTYPTPSASHSHPLLSTSQSQLWETLFDAHEAMLIDHDDLPGGQLDLASELRGAVFDNYNLTGRSIDHDLSFLISEDLEQVEEDAPRSVLPVEIFLLRPSSRTARPPPHSLLK
ncbi:hypothetical protein C0995_004103 [Termitomyces sp. Mi166|nr:hypothetical protein C0995_004103 [Termitomyces sp. Mi166\